MCFICGSTFTAVNFVWWIVSNQDWTAMDGWMCPVNCECMCSDHEWCQIKSYFFHHWKTSVFICVCGRPTTTKLFNTFHHHDHISWFPVLPVVSLFYSNVINDTYTYIEWKDLSILNHHHQLCIATSKAIENTDQIDSGQWMVWWMKWDTDMYHIPIMTAAKLYICF